MLIIGPGGGNEIFTAQEMGAARVTGVELNPVMLGLSRDRYADFVGHIYQASNSEPVVGEGRSYVRRTDRSFDIIQLSGVDTWSGLSSGAYVLAENYLYTAESFTDFLDHLNPDGILSVGRFRFDPPRESLRLVSLAYRALEEEGVARPEDHIVVISFDNPFLARILVKKSPYEPVELDTLGQAVQLAGGIVWAAPGLVADNPYSNLVAAYAGGYEEEVFDAYPYDISPVYDDRPLLLRVLQVVQFLGRPARRGRWRPEGPTGRGPDGAGKPAAGRDPANGGTDIPAPGPLPP